MKNLFPVRASLAVLSLIALSGMATAQDVFPFTDDNDENPGPASLTEVWDELPAVAPVYQLVEIATLGGTESFATAISDNGWIVGGARLPRPVGSTTSYTRAFRTQIGEAMEDLGVLPGLGFSAAYGVNDNGEVVGISSSTASLFGSTAQPFMHRNSTMIDLDPFNFGVHAGAAGVNNAGWVVGTNSFVGTGSVESFKWRTGAPVNLPNFNGDTCRISYGTGINQRGDAVGYSNPVSNCGDSRAVVYPVSGGIVDLGTLGGANAIAQGINYYGAVVGFSETVTGQNRATYWDNGTIRNLGTLGGASFATGVNDEGTVVGYFLDNRNTQRACVWMGDTMYDLNTMLANGSGWRLLIATGINASGQIVGQGRNPAGQLRGFVLTPPCRSDFNRDGGVDGADVGEYFDAWDSALPESDINWDGGIDGQDVQYYLNLWVGSRC